MTFDWKKPALILAAIVVVGGFGLGYSAIVFHNGVDASKDSGMIAVVGAVTLLAKKLLDLFG